MRYAIRGVRAEQVVSWTVEASDDAQARAKALDAGIRALSVQPLASLPWTRKANAPGLPVLLFSEQMLALLEAGLPVTDSLQALQEQESNPVVRACYARLLQSLAHGQRFSRALQSCGGFPALYLGLMRSAEYSSDLPEALRRYVEHHRQMAALRQRLVAASIYPLLLSGVGIAVILFLAGYVVPRFAAVYQASGRAVPQVSAWLLAAHDGVAGHPLLSSAGLLIFAGLGILGLQHLRREGRWQNLLADLPGLGPRIQVFWLGQLYRTLGLLLQAGMPLPDALALTQQVLPRRLGNALAQADRRVRDGGSLARALAEVGLVVPVCLRLLQAGERSSQLAAMLTHCARHCDDETTRWIDRATRLFEPLMMTVIGIIVGALVLMLYMPIFELTGTLS